MNPFAQPVEPITATDEEIRARPGGRRDPAAVARPRVPDRRHVVAARGHPSRSAAVDDAPAGWPHRGATGRRSRDRPRRADRLPRRRVQAGAPTERRRARSASWSTPSAAPTWRRTCRCSKRSWPYRGEDRRAPTWRKPTSPPTPTSRSSIVGAGMSGLLAAHRLQQAGVDHSSCSRRTPTSAARGSRTAIPAAGSTTPTTTTATRSPSATTGRSTSRPRTSSRLLRSECADAFELREHIRFEHRGRVGDVVRRRQRCGPSRPPSAMAARRRSTPTPSSARSASSTGRHCPTSTGATPSPGPSFHSARWDHTVDLAGKRVGGHRHRCERRAVHPRDRRRRRRAPGVPAHAAVAGADARVPRRGPDGSAVALRARAVLQRVEPLLDLLAHGRRRPRSRRASTPNGMAGRRRSTRQRDDASSMLTRVPQREFADRPDLLEHVSARLPARRQADAPRQRRVGRRRSSATTSRSSPTGIREITAKGVVTG